MYSLLKPFFPFLPIPRFMVFYFPIFLSFNRGKGKPTSHQVLWPSFYPSLCLRFLLWKAAEKDANIFFNLCPSFCFLAFHLFFPLFNVLRKGTQLFHSLFPLFIHSFASTFISFSQTYIKKIAPPLPSLLTSCILSCVSSLRDDFSSLYLYLCIALNYVFLFLFPPAVWRWKVWKIYFLPLGCFLSYIIFLFCPSPHFSSIVTSLFFVHSFSVSSLILHVLYSILLSCGSFSVYFSPLFLFSI